jgi:hypothetical protein
MEMPTVTPKRSKRERTAAGELQWWERFMFSFMGPPQLGENKVREGYVANEAANLCHKCSQPWDAHERVHTGSMNYRRCPAPQG